jgi:hypothetical protein
MRRYFLSFAAVAVSLYLTACDFTSPTGQDDESSSSASVEGGADAPDEGEAYVNDMEAGAPLTKSTDFAGRLLDTDLDGEDAGCWGARNSSGYTTRACGPWGSIGSAGAQLVAGKGRAGSKAMQVTFGTNEDVAGAGLTLSSEVVNVRAWYNFAEGFDFGQGVKIARVSSFNEATQVNDIDMVMTVRSAQGSQQCGLTDMSDMGIFFNGKPVGYDWGSIGSGVKFQRGRWYAIEYQVRLNAPGRSDGSVKLWVDGALVASKEGINIRGQAGPEVKLNRLRVGGWYSNGANGASCKNPSQASTLLIDDVAVGTDYLGPQ